MLTKQDLIDYRATRNAKEGLKYDQLTEGQIDNVMVELLSHTFEEMLELRLCLNRKSWKPQPSLRGTSDESLRFKKLALEELADVLLMLSAFADAAAFSLEEVQQAVLDKMAKNLVRADHACNLK